MHTHTHTHTHTRTQRNCGDVVLMMSGAASLKKKKKKKRWWRRIGRGDMDKARCHMEVLKDFDHNQTGKERKDLLIFLLLGLEHED